MGDHFVLLVDRLLTESTLEAALESKRQSQEPMPSVSRDNVIEFCSQNLDGDLSLLPSKLVQCRICHDDDEDRNMEIPCSCCGSLKYAHRKCVQRWCNEKGDTICEICCQQFKPDYTAPKPLFHFGGTPMNFRGNWEISGRDLHNSRFFAMVTTDPEDINSDLDEFPAPTSRSLICCRIVAIIFMVLLVLRHTLPIIIYGNEESLTVFTLLLLRTVGILLPIYLMVKAFAAVQRRRQQHQLQQGPRLSLTPSDDAND